MIETLNRIKKDLESLRNCPEIDQKNLENVINSFSWIFFNTYTMTEEEKTRFLLFTPDTQKSLLTKMRSCGSSLTEILDKTEFYSGYVYFIKNNQNNLIKIGSTTNPKTRLSHLRIANPDIQFLYIIETEDYKKVEKYYHTIFNDKRIKGEWFKISLEDIKAVCPFLNCASQIPVYINSKKISSMFSDKTNYRRKKIKTS